MKSCIRRISGPLGLACLFCVGQATQPAVGQEVAPPPAGADVELEGGAEILTRGPVHEAFAEPYTVSVEAPLTVDREPPEPINEIPPDVMPEGDEVEWIPGYWGWDDERSDFIWVSGLWRNVPPGQRWVPGSWAQVANGYQWSSGFWTSADTTDVVYLPDPPASQEEGPNTAAPDDNHFWVPGSWQYASNDYAWQAGYWAPAYEDWTWMPARYVWSPFGSIYNPGFWDYNPISRGVLFSPVYFPNYTYPQFVPQNVISVGPMLISLFVRPQYGHYYYGNYYGSDFAQSGIVPWLGVGQYGDYRYDPLLSFYQTGYFNGNGGFLGRVSGWHQYYRNHPDARPAMNFADMRAARGNENADPNILRQARLNQSLDEFRRSDDRHVEMREVAAQQPDQLDEGPDADRNRPADRSNDGLPTERPERAIREPRSEQPQPGSKGPSEDARGRNPDGRNPEGRNPEGRNPEGRERSGRGRAGMAFPDAPAIEGENAQPIPRPSQQPRAKGRQNEPPVQNRNLDRGRSERGVRPQSPAPQPQPAPTPNANPPRGNRGNVNPPSGNRNPQPQGNPNAGRGASGGNRQPAQPAPAAAGAAGEQNKGSGKRDNRRP